ncbi:MAG: DUF5717 family protein [Lachnospiraceae bacterium]|nr:DUF5717 family protein [Lachnospiraceae bacterium]
MKTGTLVFQPPVLKVTAGAGKPYEGEFHIDVEGPRDVKGHICVTNLHVECPEGEFKGHSMRVPFVLHTEGMLPGDYEKGEIYVITDMGEFYYPFEVQIAPTSMPSDLGEIRNLFHFINLAKANPKQALECFLSPNFEGVLQAGAKQYLETYRTIRRAAEDTGNERWAMDEFLISTGKKAPLTYVLDKEEFLFCRGDIPHEFNVTIKRGGWGYGRVQVKSDVSFLRVAQWIEDESFVNNEATIRVPIDLRRCKQGVNEGHLIFDDGRTKLVAKVEIRLDARSVTQVEEQTEQQLFRDVMLHIYLDYRTGLKSKSECVRLAEEALGYVKGSDELMTSLYQAHLKLLCGENNGAIWLLNGARRMMGGKEIDIPLYGYFLYLMAMSGADESDRAKDLLMNYREQYPEEFILYWGMMQKDKLAMLNPALAYRGLKDFWAKNKQNPLIRLEASMVALRGPSVFHRLDEFEVALLQFMERYRLLDKSFLRQVYAAAINADYSEDLIDFLKRHPIEDEQLFCKTLCTLYMRGNCTGPDVTKAMANAISYGEKITGLYEAYVRALDFSKEGVLPDEAIRYFSFGATMDDTYMAYIYALIIRSGARISEEFEKRIHDFTCDKLSEGRADDSLAYLYRTLLTEEDMTGERCSQLSRVATIWEVNTDPKYRNIVIRQEGIAGQERYAVKRGRAMVSIYGRDYTFVLEDENGLPYIGERLADLRPVLGVERAQRLLKEYDVRSFAGCYMNCTADKLRNVTNDEQFDELLDQCRYLIESDRLSKERSKELLGALLEAANRMGREDDIREMFEPLGPENIAPQDSMMYISLLCSGKDYEKAYDAFMHFGLERADVRVFATLLQRAIDDRKGMESEMRVRLKPGFVRMIYYAFTQEKYTEDMLAYLVRHFNGTVKQMRNVFVSALNMDVDATEIAKRILEQLLMTGAYTSDREKIFRYYCSRGGDQNLIAEYLKMSAEAYVSGGEDLAPEIATYIREYVLEGNTKDLGCELAFINYYHEKIDSLSEDEKAKTAQILDELSGQGIYFPEFRDYEGLLPKLQIYREREYITFRGTRDAHIHIHYVWSKPDEEEREYVDEEMYEVFPGIYQTSFLVFWGETLQYYLTEDADGEESFILSNEVEFRDPNRTEGRGRFHMLNDIALALELKDEYTAMKLTEEYRDEDRLVKQLFRII